MSIIETMIDVPADHMQNVCGQLDSYMKKIERSLRVSLIPRDDAIKIIGPEGAVKKAKSVFSNLLELSHRGNTITEQNVDYALSLSFEEKDEQILEIDKDIICRTITGKPIKPKTVGQKTLCGCDPREDDRASDWVRQVPVRHILPWRWRFRLLRTMKSAVLS